MTQPQTKPRILCIRPMANNDVSAMLVDLAGEWVEALRLHAEVEVAQGDIDLATVCDTLGPDLIVYEAIEIARPWLGAIRNPGSHPTVPRVLLLNCDPHNPLRPLIYGMIRELRIEAAFQFGVEHSQLMPDLQGLDCFSLPLFIDPAVFIPDDAPKVFPVTVFSANLLPEFYAWRARLVAELPAHVPTFLYPHPGYGRGAGSPFAVRGRDYARVLATSHFAVADTTRLDYVVRKHLEIPAAGAVLLAPHSEALADYGFVDGETCLLGSGEELIRKIGAVIGQPGRYQAIRARGAALVHERYTRQAWTGLIEWLNCRQRRRPGEVIRQDRPLGRFTLAEASGPQPQPQRHSEVTTILSRARDTILLGGNAQAAATDLQMVAGWLGHLSEPWLLLGVLTLMHGQVQESLGCIARRAQAFQALGPMHQRFDPVEIAWITVATHLAGLRNNVEGMPKEAEGVDHLSLRRVAWLFAPAAVDPAGLEHRRDDDVLSIHWLGQETMASWCALIARIWTACGRAVPPHVLERLGNATGQAAAA